LNIGHELKFPSAIGAESSIRRVYFLFVIRPLAPLQAAGNAWIEVFKYVVIAKKLLEEVHGKKNK
jgi:hypothetical protein